MNKPTPNRIQMKTRLLLALFMVMTITHQTTAQLGHNLIGYWHNWNDPSAPYIPLDILHPGYSVVDIAFAIPEAGTDYKMTFTPDQVSPAVLQSQIQNLQAAGRKVLISIGGATAPVSLSNITERDTFVSTMTSIINYYGFDGMDIDLEGSSLALSGGTISQPVDAPIINLIDAVQQIMTNYRTTFNRKMMLTMAPEAAYVQGGMSAYGGIWGAYLPVIDALRDSLDILHVQLYNSGSMYGIDGNIYTQGTADFIVAMTEAVIQGFNTTGGAFAGLPASKVAVGLPACPLAAGGGFADTAIVKDAMDYLLGNGPQPGSYVMAQSGGYPQLRGMMTWSMNWDAVYNCYNSYSFVANYNLIFFGSTGVALAENLSFIVYPNPAQDMIRIQSGIPFSEGTIIDVLDIQGNLIISTKAEQGNYVHELGTSLLAKGMYLIKIESPASVLVMRISKL